MFGGVCERRVKGGCQTEMFCLTTIIVKLTGLSHKQNKGKGSVASAQRAKQNGAKKEIKKTQNQDLKPFLYTHITLMACSFLGGRKCERKRRISTVAESFVGWRHGKLKLLLLFRKRSFRPTLFPR
uniref:(northern house mosquito) hypothetical protein n=1 Tax=Culex pipiens TaxID=7175 RepID=A0A8D8IX70_CULPI